MKNEPHWEIRGGLTLLVMKGGWREEERER